MTHNQLQYWTLEESKRHNKANEYLDYQRNVIEERKRKDNKGIGIAKTVLGGITGLAGLLI